MNQVVKIEVPVEAATAHALSDTRVLRAAEFLAALDRHARLAMTGLG